MRNLEIIIWIQEKLPLIVISLFGVIAGEVARSDESKREFKLKYVFIYIASALVVVGLIDGKNLSLGYQVVAVVSGGFIGKELLIFCSRIIRKKFGVPKEKKDGNDSKDID